ncbi:hypothetical protein IFM89_030411 [Coptis chinensis]|uniref:Uncharacterized protein n=1 Tax=Coptis chinensis TaxID=261450 RepID=A0A835HYZ4_9MAGN|nr:hypothetical protein IFM89_030411 [Coptis chinensis]
MGANERVLRTYNGTLMPGTDQPFRLNWPSFGIGERHPDAGPEHSIFVGDLAPDVMDYLLQETFRARYPSVRGAKPNRISLCYSKEGSWFLATVIILHEAVYPTLAFCTVAVQPFPTVDNDITNTTMKSRQSAEVAIQRLNGTMIGQQTVRLSWGRNQLGIWAQPSDPHQWNGAYYGYGQGYDAYGYGAAPDPSLYSYGAYTGYGRHFQAEGSQEMVAMAGVVPSVEQKEELYDPLGTPNVGKLNSAYLAVHGSVMVGRPLWLKTSALYQQA